MTVTDDSLQLLEAELVNPRRQMFADGLKQAFNLDEGRLSGLCRFFEDLDRPTFLATPSFEVEPYLGPSRERRRHLLARSNRGDAAMRAELDALSKHYADRYEAITGFCGQFPLDIRNLLVRTIRDSVIRFGMDLSNPLGPVVQVEHAPQGMLEYALRTGFSLSFGELLRVAAAMRQGMRQPNFWTEGVELPIGESARREEQVRWFFSQTVFGSLSLEIKDLLAKKLRNNVTGFGVTQAPADTIGTLVVFHSGALG